MFMRFWSISPANEEEPIEKDKKAIQTRVGGRGIETNKYKVPPIQNDARLIHAALF